MQQCCIENYGEYVKLLFQYAVLGDHTKTLSPVNMDEDRTAFDSLTMMDDMQVCPLCYVLVIL